MCSLSQKETTMTYTMRSPNFFSYTTKDISAHSLTLNTRARITEEYCCFCTERKVGMFQASLNCKSLSKICLHSLAAWRWQSCHVYFGACTGHHQDVENARQICTRIKQLSFYFLPAQGPQAAWKESYKLPLGAFAQSTKDMISAQNNLQEQ